MTRLRTTLPASAPDLWVDTRTADGWRLLHDAQETTLPNWLARQLIAAGLAVDLDEPAAHAGTPTTVTVAADCVAAVWSPSAQASIAPGASAEVPADEAARLALYVAGRALVAGEA